MRQKIIKLDGDDVYVINIPESYSDGELSMQDKLILRLHDELESFKDIRAKEGLKYIKDCYVLDSNGLPALLLGDAKKLLEITTGTKIKEIGNE